MSGTKKADDLSLDLLETILATFNTEDEKEIARKIVNRFIECGLSVKVKQYNQPCMQGTYRILCFIKKSAEAVIINNKGMGRDGVSVQVRIDDRSTFDKLDSFSENIKNQILDSTDCGYCSAKCDKKRYVFTYRENEYIKCHVFCVNFIFQNTNKNDNECLMDIINNEIAYKQTNRK
jgi:hypothetical protein